MASCVDSSLDSLAGALHSLRGGRAVPGQHLYLSGVFAPLHDEFPPTPIVPSGGTIPPELRGFFARVGPSPRHPPRGGLHLFDGDGVVVGIRFRENGAACTAAYVRTERYCIEDAAGAAIFPKIGDMHGVTGVSLLVLEATKQAVGGPASTSRGMGTANTALQYHAGRLLSLNEGDLPWALRVLCDGALETLSGVSFGEALGTRTFTAHPKLDARTGELLWFSYDVSQPRLAVGILDADGVPSSATQVALRFSQMTHDFTFTRSFVLIFDLPLAFDAVVMLTQDRLPFVYDKARGARFGLLRRGAAGKDVQWFALPGCMIFHSLAAWEEERADGSALVRLFACRLEDFDLTLPSAQGSDPAFIDGGSPTLFEFTFDTRSGEATQRCVVPLPTGCSGMDFPTCSPALRGSKLRFGYLALFRGLLITGCAKVDLEAGAIVARFDYPAGLCGGEALFVPTPGGSAEDDGHVLSIASTADASWLYVWGAASLSLLAVLPLPARVPYGFHSTFITEAELAAQRV